MIDQYGWSDRFGQAFAPHAALGLAPGRILIQQRGLYIAITAHGELACGLTGRLVHEAGEAGLPAVGDWVALSPRPAEGAATIHAVLPRRTAFVRQAAGGSGLPQVVAANVDVALLAASMNADFNPRRLERYLAAAWQSGARPLVVLTKSDLSPDPEAILAEAQSLAIGADVLAVSALTSEGVPALAAHLKPGQTAVIVGSSGAGKSTLVNALAGTDLMGTGAIREDDARGRHTTTHRELVRVPSGALILDTPGMRELGLMDAGEGLSAAFDDIEALAAACRFTDCHHAGEPGCAVRDALEDGQLDPARWRSFQKLERELAHLDRKDDRAAQAAHRKRWVAVAKANRARTRGKGAW